MAKVIQKSQHEINLEQRGEFSGKPTSIERRKCVKHSEHSPLKVGEVVTVRRWGTFGAWDEHNRWVDFYNTEPVK